MSDPRTDWYWHWDWDWHWYWSWYCAIVRLNDYLLDLCGTGAKSLHARTLSEHPNITIGPLSPGEAELR